MAKLKNTSVNGKFEVPKSDTALANFIDIIYPVGSIYLSTVDVNPSNFLPNTTWEQFAIGKTLVGYSGGYYTTEITNSNQMIDDSLYLLKSGGEEKHTLTAAEMPNHNHEQYVTANPGSGPYNTRTDYDADGKNLHIYYQCQTGAAGGGQSHNNCMPYITVSIWRRTS